MGQGERTVCCTVLLLRSADSDDGILLLRRPYVRSLDARKPVYHEKLLATKRRTALQRRRGPLPAPHPAMEALFTCEFTGSTQSLVHSIASENASQPLRTMPLQTMRSFCG